MRALLAVLIALSAIGAVVGAPWRFLRRSSGAWRAVLEVESGRVFRLHPRALVTRARSSTDCATLLLDVRFWSQVELQSAERDLRGQQLCSDTSRCRLEPFQALSVAVRDQLGNWESTLRRRFLPQTMPHQLRFKLRRRTITSGNCSAALTSADLRGLVIELTTAPKESLRLSVDISQLTRSDDLELRVPISMTSWDDFLLIKDCLEVKLRGLPGGVYILKSLARVVVCTSRGEMVVVRRSKMDTDFNAGWTEYRRGIGDPRSQEDFFAGLDLLRAYTAGGLSCMRLDLRPKSSSLPARFGLYSNFIIGSRSTDYKLLYKWFKGSLVKDPLLYHKGFGFSTMDHGQKTSCSRQYEGGNWFKSCWMINIIGSAKHFKSQGVHKGSPGSEILLQSAQMTLRSVVGDPEALTTVLLIDDPPCPAVVREWTAPNTTQYVITVGGAPGGRSGHQESPAGGRGALVQGRVLLTEGAKLRLVVGCRGSSGPLSGGGGDGSFVMAESRKRLLMAAGGGGGAGSVSGNPGLARSQGGPPKLASGVARNVTRTPALGWSDLRAILLAAPGANASSGGQPWTQRRPTNARGGGGGGGFGGGFAARDAALAGQLERAIHSAGGGGGSWCNGAAASNCTLESGGNALKNGFLKIEAFLCF